MWHKNIAHECGTGMLNKPSEIEEIFVPNAPCLKKARKQLHPIQNFPFKKKQQADQPVGADERRGIDADERGGVPVMVEILGAVV